MTQEIKKTVEYNNGVLSFIDQRFLPLEKNLVHAKTVEEIAFAIEEMQVRGAPLIGVTAAYGIHIASLEFSGKTMEDFLEFMNKAQERLRRTRPTAKNLFWAIDRMMKLVNSDNDISKTQEILKKEADEILDEDVRWNVTMGNHGASLFEGKVRIMTHCNAGAMATGGYGTALGVIRSLHAQGKLEMVYVDETRPRLQGARITAFELNEDNIPYKVVSDNMAAHIMTHNMIDGIVTGADRIALNGDSANKIGTCGLAIIAKRFNIPFYIAAPSSTFDLSIKTGKEIVIEEREANEIRLVGKTQIVPDNSDVFNPSFDVTPAELIKSIITERGVIKPDYIENIAKIME